MSTEEFFSKIDGALLPTGTFPVAAKIIDELHNALAIPTTTDIELAEIATRDPSIALRIFHLVHSRDSTVIALDQPFNDRNRGEVSALLGNLVSVQRFMPTVRAGNATETMLELLIISTELTRLFNETVLKANRTQLLEAVVIGSFPVLGSLVGCFCVPQLFETIVRRMDQGPESFEQAVITLTGSSPLDLSTHVLSRLDLPEELRSQFNDLRDVIDGARPSTGGTALLLLAYTLAKSIVFGDRAHLARTLPEAATRAKVEPDVVRLTLRSLASGFDRQCTLLGVAATLPDYVVTFGKGRGGGTFRTALTSVDEVYQTSLRDLKESIERSEPITAILLAAMEFLVWEFGYEQARLLLADGAKRKLVETKSLGTSAETPPIQTRPLVREEMDDAVEVRAFFSGQLVSSGTALRNEASRFVAIPIGFQDRCIGVIYADETDTSTPLKPSQVATLQNLCDLLDEAAREELVRGSATRGE